METFESEGPVTTSGIVYHPLDNGKGKESAPSSSSHGDSIDEQGLPTEQAFGRFVNKKVLMDENFADMIVPKTARRNGNFVPGQTEFEALTSGERAEETPLQKFHRLQHEVKVFTEELAQKAKSESVDGSGNSDGKEDLSALAMQMQSLYNALVSNVAELESRGQPAGTTGEAVAVQYKVENLTGQVMAQVEQAKGDAAADSKSAAVTYEIYYSKALEDAKQANASKLARLEKRVAGLERSLGGASAGSLEVKVSELEKTIRMASAQDVHLIQVRLQRLRESLAEAKRLQEEGKKFNPVDAEKIDKLFEKVERTDPAAQQLPAVLARLHALRGLHEKSATLVKDVQALSDSQKQIEMLLKEDAQLLATVQKGFAENLNAIQGNMKGLQERIARVEQLANK